MKIKTASFVSSQRSIACYNRLIRFLFSFLFLDLLFFGFLFVGFERSLSLF